MVAHPTPDRGVGSSSLSGLKQHSRVLCVLRSGYHDPAKHYSFNVPAAWAATACMCPDFDFLSSHGHTVMNGVQRDMATAGMISDL